MTCTDEELTALARALARLPRDQTRLIVLLYSDGLDLGAAAREMGLTREEAERLRREALRTLSVSFADSSPRGGAKAKVQGDRKALPAPAGAEPPGGAEAKVQGDRKALPAPAGAEPPGARCCLIRSERL